MWRERFAQLGYRMNGEYLELSDFLRHMARVAHHLEMAYREFRELERICETEAEWRDLLSSITRWKLTTFDQWQAHENAGAIIEQTGRDMDARHLPTMPTMDRLHLPLADLAELPNLPPLHGAGDDDDFEEGTEYDIGGKRG